MDVTEEKISYTEEWIPASDLIPGHIYVKKNGKIVLYLGRDIHGMYVFYVFTSAYLRYFIDENDNTSVTFGNYKAQIEGLKTVIIAVMEDKPDKACVVDYKIMPQIFGEFPFLKYDDIYLDWYSAVSAENKEMPVLCVNGVKSLYVSVRDLVPGKLYYSGDSYRSVFVFMGRASDGSFLWHRILNAEDFIARHNDMAYMLRNAIPTKTYKRVKPLSSVVSDKYAYMGIDTKKLLEWNGHVDMKDVTQGMLDSANEEYQKYLR